MRSACLLLLILACLDSIEAFLARECFNCLCDLSKPMYIQSASRACFLLAFAATALPAVHMILAMLVDTEPTQRTFCYNACVIYTASTTAALPARLPTRLVATMSAVEARLSELGLSLPPVMVPKGAWYQKM